MSGSPSPPVYPLPPQKRPVMLSAVQPSNKLTLGNYLGAIKNWVQLQKEFDCYFFAVDLHAITLRQDPEQLREQTYRALATYIAAGIDPNACTLFAQSHVPEHAELAWVLLCHSAMGELSRMTQFKDKSAKASGGSASGENIPSGLFAYPALMAADILLYDSNLIPVGDDQKQHVELTRELAFRMNNQYAKRFKPNDKIDIPFFWSAGNPSANGAAGEEGSIWDKPLFRIPQVFTPPAGARVMSLQAPAQKMSKSDPDPNGAIYLDDSNDAILKKFKRAVTDSGSEIKAADDKPGVSNLLGLQRAITGKSIAELEAHFQGKQYGHLKIETAERVIEALEPIRERTQALMSDRAELERVLKKGAERARAHAARTLARVYDRIGMIPR